MPGASLGVAVRLVEIGIDNWQVKDFLPTVTTQDGKNNAGPSQFERNTLPLNAQVMDFATWGRFEPAIERWAAVIGRPAPSPTNADGKDGSHRLSPKFCEWIMGLPEGWITGPDVTRNESLKMAGNGVVPQQAAAAIRFLLDSIQDEKIEEMKGN
jgi:hypothetical protein